MQLDLPRLTLEQIQKLEDFTKLINQLGFQFNRQKNAIIAAYKDLVGSIPFDVFWEAMAQANIPHHRPDNFAELPEWEQINFIRQVGLPIAWTLIPQLREVAQSDASEPAT